MMHQHKEPRNPVEPPKFDKERWLKFGAGALGLIVVLQSPILALIPRFFEKQIKMENGHIPPGLWALGFASIAAAVFTALDKSWSKKREDAAKKQEAEAKKRRTDQEGFFRSYAQCLKDAIEAAQTSGELNSEEIHKVQQFVLKLVCNIVESFLGKPDGLQINASLMRDEQVEIWQTKDLRFASSTRTLDAYRSVLHLTVWATPPNDEPHIVLPVAKNSDILLFGAPKSLVQGQMEYVTDTQNPEVLEGLVARQDDEVRSAIKSYLERRKGDLVSFISAPLRCGNAVVGVLNVQSNRPEILGVNETYRNSMEDCLLPLCALLGILIAQENSRQNATSTSGTASN